MTLSVASSTEGKIRLAWVNGVTDTDGDCLKQPRMLWSERQLLCKVRGTRSPCAPSRSCQQHIVGLQPDRNSNPVPFWPFLEPICTCSQISHRARLPAPSRQA